LKSIKKLFTDCIYDNSIITLLNSTFKINEKFEIKKNKLRQKLDRYAQAITVI